MTYDLVVFGGSPAGVAAAVCAAERNRSVVLICQGKTVGGAISNGLGAADIGGNLAVTGFPMRFFQAVRNFYGNPATWNCPPYRAEAIFRSMLSTAGVTVIENAELTSISVNGGQIEWIGTTHGAFAGQHFIDATYTGELLAKAGTPYRLGYEDYFHYGDSYTTRTMTEMAGVAGKEHHFDGHPYISQRAKLPKFEDVFREGMPTMTFRVPVTNVASNRVPFAPTETYELYEPSFRAIAKGFFEIYPDSVGTRTNGSIFSPIMQLAITQDGKYDLNQGEMNLMNVPMPIGIFGSPSQRAAEIAKFADYMKNWLYFCTTDASVWLNTRDALAPFGLCADEFTDNDHWPYEPYIREGRRLVGHKTLQVKNIYDPSMRVSPESCAVGTYVLDSKSSMTFVAEGKLWRDKGLHLGTPWYEIDRRVMIPINIDNLVVPVCFASSPRAHGSPRMEPQYMAMGEAAGLMAHLSMTHGTSIIHSTASGLKYLLDQNGARSKLSQLCPLIPAAYRASAGFSSTCTVQPYTP